ncbi:MAG: hypothetical protein O7G85_16010 [Planctomycetota bacterium]|nr:hypothetical protein [Planctomycetota bacterium]
MDYSAGRLLPLRKENGTQGRRRDWFVFLTGSLLAAPLGPEDIKDHEKAISDFFSDPDGNHLEVTTYDHAKVRKELL